MQRILLALFRATVFGAAVLACSPYGHAGEVQAGSTHWQVRTSIGFDALCALNILSGDPYYVEQYPAEAGRFAGPAYTPAREAAVELKRIIKDEDGGIVSAFLTLVMSGTDDRAFDSLLAAVEAPEELRATFMKSTFGNTESWARFERSRPHLKRALRAMQEAGFERWWREGIEPKSNARAAELLGTLARHDVLGEHRRLLGPGFMVRDIEVILLYFSRPHGIRIQGDRYLTNAGYPAHIVLRNAAHEPLHGGLALDEPQLRDVVRQLTSGRLIANAVAKHDAKFGYNSARGYAEEDLVQALEQVVSERLGFALDNRKRWREGDDGMHILAASVYELMQETGFARDGGSFREWLVASTARGAFSDAEVERRARARLGDDHVALWLSK